MKILVCGSRDFPARDIVFDLLEAWYDRCGFELTVIHGACNTELDTRQNKELGIGADAIAHDFCINTPDVEEIACPANWSLHGKRAGFVRNAAMLALNPGLVLGFMNKPSPGTTMMMDLAAKKNIPVYRIQQWIAK